MFTPPPDCVNTVGLFVVPIVMLPPIDSVPPVTPELDWTYNDLPASTTNEPPAATSTPPLLIVKFVEVPFSSRACNTPSTRILSVRSVTAFITKFPGTTSVVPAVCTSPWLEKLLKAVYGLNPTGK